MSRVADKRHLPDECFFPFGVLLFSQVPTRWITCTAPLHRLGGYRCGTSGFNGGQVAVDPW